MKTYYDNMNLLHISLAAFETRNGQTTDYIRARKYPVAPKANFNTTTEIPPAFFNTGLFLPGKTYKITVIKAGRKLYFSVTGDGVSKLFSWDTSGFPDVTEGRIGLRHMFGRTSVYRNFRVFTKQNL